MTFIADLAPCSYLDATGELGLLAVGWLSECEPHVSGVVAPAVRERLQQLLDEPSFCPVGFFGSHFCEYCSPKFPLEPTRAVPHGCGNLIVPSSRRLYACPELVAHYIDAHGYSPPQEFCEAVLACPAPSADGYYELLFATGGEQWQRMFERAPRSYDDATYTVGHRVLQRWRARTIT